MLVGLYLAKRVRSSANDKWKILEPLPVFGTNLSFNAPCKHFHTHDKQVRGHGISLPDASSRVEKINFPPIFTRISMEEVVTQDMMSLIRLLKKSKK